MSALDDDWEEGFATGILPWDLPAQHGGPRRGSLDDYGKAVCLDDEEDAPDKLSMLYADLVNGLQRHAEAMDQSVPAVSLSVGLTGGGAFTLQQVTGPGASARTLATFTVTPNGTGDVSITWDAGTFPAPIRKPSASLNDPVTTHGGGINVVSISNGIRVFTWTGANTAANRPFSAEVW